MCFGQFDQWKAAAYNRMVMAHDQLKSTQVAIEELRKVVVVRTEQLDKLHLVVFEKEHRWNYLMKLQVQ